LTAYYVRQEGYPYVLFRWQPFEYSVLKRLFQYGLTSLLVGSAYYVSHLILKVIIVDSLGLEVNGIYQPIWALTMTYLTLVLSSMSTYSYPRLCELNTARDISEELNGIVRIALLLIVPVMFFLLLARVPIIRLLYSSRFLLATRFMPVQILGDFFKVLFWSVGMYLLPTKRLLAFITLNLLQDALLVFFAVLWVGTYQLDGICAGFTLSYFLAFLALYAYTKRELGFSLWVRNQTLLLSSLGALLAIIIADRYPPLGSMMPVAPLAILSWLMLAIKQDELLQLKGYLLEKLSRTGIM
jgi:PST family polysaccharide transporter